VTALGWTVAGIITSPIAGGDGNREFFIGAHRN
jgi:23S rRNA (cytidine1920-2'-O)/16S rRNA (cytidine1409-2'-O)-methyltransferase